MVGVGGVAEPDAAFGLDLLEIGAPVGGEDERHLVLAPRPAGEREIVARTNSLE